MTRPCKIMQAGDSTRCATCGFEWDTNESPEPECFLDVMRRRVNARIWVPFTALWIVLTGSMCGSVGTVMYSGKVDYTVPLTIVLQMVAVAVVTLLFGKKGDVE